MRKKYAFTLAEVLITLGIIGIVAALTIPTLISNYQKTVYIAQLKKAVSTFDNAMQQLTAAYDCGGDVSCTGIISPVAYATTNLSTGNLFVPYFNIAKNCLTTLPGCYPENVKKYDGTPRSGGDISQTDWYKFITADGTSYAINFEIDRESCVNAKSTSPCGVVVMDVNGPLKGPNYMGRDIFVSRFYGNGLISYYSPGNNTPCSENEWFCFDKILKEGWEMNY